MVYRQSKRRINNECVGKWLETSLGWARANIIYDKKSEIPEYGTLEEVLFMLVWKKRQTIHAMQIRAVAQSALGGKEAEDAYKEFVNELTQSAPEKKDNQMKTRLEEMKSIQAIKVTPLAPITKSRKLKKVEK